MLSSQIEWTWVHWCAAKPTHLAAPRALRPLALSLSPPLTLFTVLFPSATHFLSPCLLFSSCPQQFLPPSYLYWLLTTLWIWLMLWCYACMSFFFKAACLLKKDNPINMEMFLIWAKTMSVQFYVILIALSFTLLYPTLFSQAVYKSCLLQQNWWLLTPTMVLNLTMTISNLSHFIPLMCTLNEEVNLSWFWCKTGNLYNISVVLVYFVWMLHSAAAAYFFVFSTKLIRHYMCNRSLIWLIPPCHRPPLLYFY